MYQQLDVTGRAVKVGALTITGTFAGEMEPLDRCAGEEIPGVRCASGSVFFEYRGREYSQDFSAAWFDDGTIDYWDDNAPIMAYSETDGGLIEATGAECAAIERAANDPAALHLAILSAQRAATEAANSKAQRFLDKCVSEGEA